MHTFKEYLTEEKKISFSNFQKTLDKDKKKIVKSFKTYSDYIVNNMTGFYQMHANMSNINVLSDNTISFIFVGRRGYEYGNKRLDLFDRSNAEHLDLKTVRTEDKKLYDEFIKEYDNNLSIVEKYLKTEINKYEYYDLLNKVFEKSKVFVGKIKEVSSKTETKNHSFAENYITKNDLTKLCKKDDVMDTFYYGDTNRDCQITTKKYSNNNGIEIELFSILDRIVSCHFDIITFNFTF